MCGENESFSGGDTTRAGGAMSPSQFMARSTHAVITVSLFHAILTHIKRSLVAARSIITVCSLAVENPESFGLHVFLILNVHHVSCSIPARTRLNRVQSQPESFDRPLKLKRNSTARRYLL